MLCLQRAKVEAVANKSEDYVQKKAEKLSETIRKYGNKLVDVVETVHEWEEWKKNLTEALANKNSHEWYSHEIFDTYHNYANYLNSFNYADYLKPFHYFNYNNNLDYNSDDNSDSDYYHHDSHFAKDKGKNKILLDLSMEEDALEMEYNDSEEEN